MYQHRKDTKNLKQKHKKYYLSLNVPNTQKGDKKPNVYNSTKNLKNTKSTKT